MHGGRRDETMAAVLCPYNSSTVLCTSLTTILSPREPTYTNRVPRLTLLFSLTVKRRFSVRGDGGGMSMAMLTFCSPWYTTSRCVQYVRCVSDTTVLCLLYGAKNIWLRPI